MFKSILGEFELKRDADSALKSLRLYRNEDVLEEERKSIIAKLTLIRAIQREVINQVEDLGRAKKLLERLDLQTNNILYVLDQIDFSQTGNVAAVLEDLDDELFDGLLQAIGKKKQRVEPNTPSITSEKLFQHALAYAPPSSLKYTNKVIEQFVEFIAAHKWENAFNLLLSEVEPDIPKNLRVPRMHEPLLQKYLWAALKGFEQAQLYQHHHEPLSLQEMQQCINLSRYDFDLEHAEALKESLESL